MARRLGWAGVALRFALALVVVTATWNPTGASFWHWITSEPLAFTPTKGLAGVGLLIGWVVLLRATLRSLGGIGILLAGGLFGFGLWSLIYWGLVPSDSFTVLQWLAMMLVVSVLTVGVCWSHIRRRLSGQYDVDDIDMG